MFSVSVWSRTLMSNKFGHPGYYADHKFAHGADPSQKMDGFEHDTEKS